MSRSTIDQITREILNKKQLIVVSGAGVSTRSGIPDFVQLDQSWTYDVPRNEAISIGFLKKNPEKFWGIYHHVFLNDATLSAQPSSAHQYLAWLEAQGVNVNIFTQNVDGLHQQAGSSKVVELHGNIHGAECVGRRHEYSFDQVFDKEGNLAFYHCPVDNSLIRPLTVLFGDYSKGYEQIKKHFEKRISQNTIAVFMGTSLRVYPIATWPAAIAWNPLITNVLWDHDAEKSDQLDNFDYWLNDDFADIAPRFLKA